MYTSLLGILAAAMLFMGLVFVALGTAPLLYQILEATARGRPATVTLTTFLLIALMIIVRRRQFRLAAFEWNVRRLHAWSGMTSAGGLPA